MKKPTFRQVMISKFLPAIIILLLNFNNIKCFSQEWQAIQQLVTVPGQSCWLPRVAVFEDHVFVSWTDKRDAPNYQAYLRRSDNRGESFQPGTRLSNDDNISCIGIQLCTWENNVYAVWTGYEASNGYQVYFCYSDNMGEHFSDPVRLTSVSSNSIDADITVFEDNLHIVWYDDKEGSAYSRIYYMKSTDNGATWSPEIPLGLLSINEFGPRIALDGHNIYVAWVSFSSGIALPDIAMTKSYDNGENWDASSIIFNTLASMSDPVVSICASENAIHMSWDDKRDGPYYKIYYSRSLDGGNTWEPENCLNSDAGPYNEPDISCFGDVVHCAWWSSDTRIEYRKSLNSGQDWEPTVIISSTGVVSYTPGITSFNDNVYVAWEQKNSSADFDIYFRCTASDFSIDDNSSVYNDRPHLYQNYPNPVINYTQLSFYLPENTRSWLNIYNAAGVLIERIGDAQYAKGKYSIQWNRADHRAGVYYYQLHILNHASPQIKKMILY